MSNTQETTARNLRDRFSQYDADAKALEFHLTRYVEVTEGPLPESEMSEAKQRTLDLIECMTGDLTANPRGEVGGFIEFLVNQNQSTQAYGHLVGLIAAIHGVYSQTIQAFPTQNPETIFDNHEDWYNNLRSVAWVLQKNLDQLATLDPLSYAGRHSHDPVGHNLRGCNPGVDLQQ